MKRNTPVVKLIHMESSHQDNRHLAGAIGERAVSAYVKELGWQIVDRNVRWREGELDLIAIDGSTLVVAEVKTLVGRGEGGNPAFSPFESITARKQEQIRSLARRWLSDDARRQGAETSGSFSGLRFDAFAVVLGKDRSVRNIEHLEDAF